MQTVPRLSFLITTIYYNHQQVKFYTTWGWGCNWETLESELAQATPLRLLSWHAEEPRRQHTAHWLHPHNFCSQGQPYVPLWAAFSIRTRGSPIGPQETGKMDINGRRGGERSWHETRSQLVGQEDPEGQERELRNHSEAPRKYIIWWITF